MKSNNTSSKEKLVPRICPRCKLDTDRNLKYCVHCGYLFNKDEKIMQSINTDKKGRA
ncbi:MAG: hypothetical protein ACTSVI_13415 [Promethearchaeota archaeon]